MSNYILMSEFFERYSPEDVYDMYIFRNLTSEQISEICNIKEKNLEYVFTKYNINKLQFRQEGLRNIFTKEYLEEIYINQNRTKESICEEYKISRYIIEKFLDEYSIVKSKEMKRRSCSKLSKEWLDITREELYDLYVTQNMMREDICAKFNIGMTTFKAKCKKFGIRKPIELIVSNNKSYGYNKGWRPYTDGVETRMIKDGNVIPEGWYKGHGSKWYEKFTEAQKTRKLTPEGRARVVESGKRNKGRTWTPEQRRKRQLWLDTHPSPLLGRKLTEEQKRHLSEINTGKEVYSEKREKLRAQSKEFLESFLSSERHILYRDLSEVLNLPKHQGTDRLIAQVFKEKGIKYKEYKTISDFENAIKTLVNINKDEQILENTRAIVQHCELDVYLPERSLAIECNGLYWHKTLFDENYKPISNKRSKDIYTHQNKALKCLERNIRLFYITEDFYENEYKYKVLKSYINELNGIVRSITDYIIKEVSKEEYNNFYKNTMTLLVKDYDKCYGLYINDILEDMICLKDNIIVFKSKNYNNECPIENNMLLIDYIKKEYNFNELFFDCDFTHDNIFFYYDNGFKKIEVLEPKVRLYEDKYFTEIFSDDLSINFLINYSKKNRSFVYYDAGLIRLKC